MKAVSAGPFSDAEFFFFIKVITFGGKRVLFRFLRAVKRIMGVTGRKQCPEAQKGCKSAPSTGYLGSNTEGGKLRRPNSATDLRLERPLL